MTTPDLEEQIRFSVPLPPRYLRSNARSHWGVKSQAKIAYSADVYWAFDKQITDPRLWPVDGSDFPWERAKVTYTWCHAGVAPDISNLGANTKALQDFLCVAPNTGLQRNDCFYLGIVADDKHIEPTYRLRKVPHRADECVEIRVTRL